MPTYVYECETCKVRFEKNQRMSEDPIVDCECGSKGSVRRVIQPVGIAFKGSGFYVTDYANGSSPSTSAPAPSSTPAPSASAESCTGNPSSCACNPAPTSN